MGVGVKKPKRDVEVEAAIAAIEEVFGDTSVSKEETLDRMHEILANLQTSIDCLKADIKKEQDES